METLDPNTEPGGFLKVTPCMYDGRLIVQVEEPESGCGVNYFQDGSYEDWPDPHGLMAECSLQIIEVADEAAASMFRLAEGEEIS